MIKFVDDESNPFNKLKAPEMPAPIKNNEEYDAL